MDEFLKLVFLAVFAGIGAFLGSYFKRKGENLATHEDISKLVDQVRAVTTATKEIEAKISNEVWDKQKQWELKRDVLFETIKRIAAVKDALFDMRIFYFPAEDEDDAAKKGITIEQRNEVSKKVWDAESSFDQTTFLAALVCGDEVNRLLLAFGRLMRRCAKEISKGERDAAKNSLNDLHTQADGITAAMRREIGVSEPA
jgi:hypothetical protein